MSKKLSLLDATLVVSGSMIGSGIFIVSSEMSRTLGSAGWLMLAWLLTGVITLLAALSYGELASMMPKAGGQYVYITRAYGKMMGFLYGWSAFTVIQTGVLAAVAVAFAKYSAVFFPGLSKMFIGTADPDNFNISYGQLLAIIIVVVITYLNSLGLREAKTIQRIFTMAKLLALAMIIVLGIYYGLKLPYLTQNFSNPFEAFSASNESMSLDWVKLSGIGVLFAFGTALIGSLFSSDAWNSVTFLAGEIESPSKNIPRSLLLGTLIVTILYCLANLAYLCLLPVKGHPVVIGDLKEQLFANGISHANSDRIGTAAVQVIFGQMGVYIMAALIMISTFGCNNGLILSSSRIYATMANEGLFFRKAGVINKHGVPAFSLWIQAGWAAVLCLSGSYGKLLEYCTFASLVFYIITISGLFILRKKEPDTERPYKVNNIIPILYILIASLIALDILVFKWQSALWGIGIVALGIPVYYGLMRTGEK